MPRWSRTARRESASTASARTSSPRCESPRARSIDCVGLATWSAEPWNPSPGRSWLLQAALDELASELIGCTGPDGRIFYDTQADREEAEPAEIVPGVRLLPEFDALLCAYEPSARMRFVDPDHHRILFASTNGLCRPPLLIDGRITGYWRLEGSGRTRALTAYSFAGTPRPPIADVRRAAASVTRALPVQLSGVEWARHRD